jgi:hypothetical protein
MSKVPLKAGALLISTGAFVCAGGYEVLGMTLLLLAMGVLPLALLDL